MIAKTTLNHVKTFCKPGVEAGIIPPDQFKELLTLAKASQGHDPAEKPELHILTVSQVADKLQCSTRTVHRMRDTGRLQGVYLTQSRKSLRFSSEAVEKLMQGDGE